MMNTNQEQFERQQGILLDSHEERIALLEHFLNRKNEDFSSFFADWGLDRGIEVPASDRQWGQEIFREHAWHDQIEKDHATFASFPREALREAVTWYSIHVKMVEAGTLDSDLFAYDRKTPKASGFEMIKGALDAKTDQEDAVDRCARNIMRNMGGIPAVRGRRSLENCPTAKFYWSYKLASDIGSELRNVDKFKSLEMREIYETLQQRTLWTILANALEYNITILANRRILAAFIAFIMEGMKSERIRRGKIEKEIMHAIEQIGPLTSLRHLAVVETQDILALFSKVDS